MRKTINILTLSVMISIVLTVGNDAQFYQFDNPLDSKILLSERAVFLGKDSRMSKQIPLTQGQFAIVKDEDFDRLNRHKWCAWWNKDTKSFYAVRHGKTENGKQYLIYMARVILGLKYGDKRQSDHINHITLDNRISNLRIVSHQQNHFNQKSPKGYCWDKARKKYQAEIGVNGKHIYLGRFHTTEEARSAYLRAKEQYHRLHSA